MTASSNAWPSPAMQPPVVHWSEVGAVEYVPVTNDSSGGRYFALLGGNPSNQVAEMIVYVAERPQGPFIAARKNRVLLPAARSCYFTRFFRGPGMALLVTHQSFSHVGRTYIAPYKAAHVDAEGTMRLAWWEGNQNLKAVLELPATITPAGWFMPPVDVAVGPSSRPPSRSRPTVHRCSCGQGSCSSRRAALRFWWRRSSARCVVANVSSAGAPTRPAIEHTWDRELSGLGAAVAVRLLFRREMLELYVDDFLLPVFLMPRSTGRVRLANHAAMAESGRSLIVDVRRWAMSLSS